LPRSSLRAIAPNSPTATIVPFGITATLNKLGFSSPSFTTVLFQVFPPSPVVIATPERPTIAPWPLPLKATENSASSYTWPACTFSNVFPPSRERTINPG
jgi:hypothetical protein